MIAPAWTGVTSASVSKRATACVASMSTLTRPLTPVDELQRLWIDCRRPTASGARLSLRGL